MLCSRRLIVQTLVFSRSYLHRRVSPPETLVVKGELLGREMAGEFCLKMPDFHVTFRDLLHAVNIRRGTNGFISLPKEGVLRIFSPWKIRRLRPGLNPRTWVPKASTKVCDTEAGIFKNAEHCTKNFRSGTCHYSLHFM